MVAAYVGAPVGAFLTYFRADDARIEAAARARGRAVDYGRDARWLDPFGYGAAAYLVVFVPRALAAGVGTAIVGAMVGVVAAGVSHFFLARLRNAPITIPIAAVAGAPLADRPWLGVPAAAAVLLLSIRVLGCWPAEFPLQRIFKRTVPQSGNTV